MAAMKYDETLLREFQAAWPVERLRSMTLSEYTKVGDRACFTNWVETRLEVFGSISGGSAFKFGIFSRAPGKGEKPDSSRAYDKDFAWYRKFGETADAAFEAIRREVVAVAEAARDGRFDDIDASPLGNSYKWKLAFHYQSLDRPSIIAAYLRKPLLAFLKLPLADDSIPQSELYRRIAMKRREQEPWLQFGERVWREWLVSRPLVVTLSAGAVRNGYISFKPGSSPFPESMRGGRDDSAAGAVARFRTDTGLEFESDVRVSSPGSARLRKRLASYFTQIGAAEGDRLYITRTSDNSYLISRSAPAEEPIDDGGEPPRDDTPMIPPLNQILFGPPGTGKTHDVVDRALAILDPDFVSTHSGDRSALKKRFDDLSHSGQVEFVTFHQSFSYEDFVEGLRADRDIDSGALRFSLEDGVFKRLCATARAVTTHAGKGVSVTGQRVWKMSLGDSRAEPHVFPDCIKSNVVLLGWGNGADFSSCQNRQDIARVFAESGEPRGLNDYPVTAVHTLMHRVQDGDLIVATEGNTRFRAIGQVTGPYRHVSRNGEDSYAQARPVRWLRVYDPALPYDRLMNNQFMQMTLYQLRDGSIDRQKLQSLLADPEPVTSRSRPYVLVIDEINRGNIARIFGELITLVESGKRAGQPEALEVVLPYSKQRFSVPSNVYLIGTMNTADRSLTGLDVALRRRFEFIEMPPKPELLRAMSVGGVSVEALLTAINLRVEALLDRDHRIGHAYFLPLAEDSSIDHLARIFRTRVLPLLQEYFFEDWHRIRLVLNDHRKPADAQFIVAQSFDMIREFGTDEGVPVDNRLWQINESALLNPESYRLVVGA